MLAFSRRRGVIGANYPRTIQACWLILLSGSPWCGSCGHGGGAIALSIHVLFRGGNQMHQPSKWWVGLVPVAALWVLANGVRTESVESDVAAQAQAVLAEARDIASAMTAKALGRDVLIEGLEFADG